MKSFDNIDDFLVFCKKNKKFCEKNKKELAEVAATIYLKNAGYTKFDGADVRAIYKELDDISSKNAIRGGNPNYLSARNEDIMNSVIATGSDNLKTFLSKNGYHIINIPRLRRLKDSDFEKQVILDTVLLSSRQGDSTRPKSTDKPLRKSAEKRHGMYIDTPHFIKDTSVMTPKSTLDV